MQNQTQNTAAAPCAAPIVSPSAPVANPMQTLLQQMGLDKPTLRAFHYSSADTLPAGAEYSEHDTVIVDTAPLPYIYIGTEYLLRFIPTSVMRGFDRKPRQYAIVTADDGIEECCWYCTKEMQEKFKQLQARNYIQIVGRVVCVWREKTTINFPEISDWPRGAPVHDWINSY